MSGHIYLYGPSGSGKSTVGGVLARELNMRFIDLDAEIEASLGRTISGFMADESEAAFRAVEAEAMQKIAKEDDAVVALGGGALLRDENRALAERTGQVIFLDADLSMLLERISADEDKRPLLSGNLETKITGLLEKRAAHYDSFSKRVNAAPAAELVAWDVQRALGRYHVRGMGQGYDLLVRENGLDQLGELLRSRGLGSPVLVVSDTNVGPLYIERALNALDAAGFAARSLEIPAGEEYKTLETVSTIWQACLEAYLDRKSTLIALGGGVVGDLGGFAAATFMRGMPWVNLPTTVLAMVDASMGGKTGFDLPEGKNLIGSFHSPRLVLADPATLSTLSEPEFISGLAEVVKHGVIADPDLFAICSGGVGQVREKLGYIIRRAMGVKVKIIQEDPFEQGIRAALNLGHTIGHAVELVSGFEIRHGEAVSIGMVAEVRIAEKLSIAARGASDALVNTLSKLELPVEIPDNLSREQIIRAMKMDKKKAAGVVRFALPVQIGEVKVGVEIENLEDVL